MLLNVQCVVREIHGKSACIPRNPKTQTSGLILNSVTITAMYKEVGMTIGKVGLICTKCGAMSSSTNKSKWKIESTKDNTASKFSTYTVSEIQCLTCGSVDYSNKGYIT